MVIREKYEGQLDELMKDLRRLGLHVYYNIEYALRSLSEEDRNYARQTIANDKDINALEKEINEKVIMLITKQQPIATYLRLMMFALKNASYFDRIDDNGINIADMSL